MKVEHSASSPIDQSGAEALPPPSARPRHVAIIMDGNGRWARRQGKPRIFGHQQGAKAVRGIVIEAARLELDMLTLYSFSSENWARPQEEVEFLMDLCAEYLADERRELMDNNIRFVQLGRREGLPDRVLGELDKTTDMTAGNTGLRLALALNYGSRSEIIDAVRAIARAAAAGDIDPERIDEDTISQHLYTAGMPEPDLLIRTAGEMRISNFLLWQISYAELWVTQTLWPEFDLAEFHRALRDFAERQRRFGSIK